MTSIWLALTMASSEWVDLPHLLRKMSFNPAQVGSRTKGQGLLDCEEINISLDGWYHVHTHIQNKLETFEDALFENGKSSTHKTEGLAHWL